MIKNVEQRRGNKGVANTFYSFLKKISFSFCLIDSYVGMTDA